MSLDRKMLQSTVAPLDPPFRIGKLGHLVLKVTVTSGSLK